MVILKRLRLLLASVDTPRNLAQETLYSSNGIGRPREDSYLLSNNPVWNREGLRRLLGTLLICPGITVDQEYLLGKRLSNTSSIPSTTYLKLWSWRVSLLYINSG